MDPDERSRLQQLIELQASELAALKEEIKSLSIKGGFLLPPMQLPGPDTRGNLTFVTCTHTHYI